MQAATIFNCMKHLKHTALAAALLFATGCQSVGAFMNKSYYTGNKIPVYNAKTERVEYVPGPMYGYNPHVYGGGFVPEPATTTQP